VERTTAQGSSEQNVRANPARRRSRCHAVRLRAGSNRTKVTPQSFLDEHMPPGASRAEEDEQPFGPTTFGLIAVASGSTRKRRNRDDGIIQELIGTLIETHHGTKRIIRFSVQVKDVFHPPEEGGSHLTQTPLSLLPPAVSEPLRRGNLRSSAVSEHTKSTNGIETTDLPKST